MLKYYTVILFLFLSISGLAQKKLEKVFDATEIENIIVNGDGIFNIKITAKPVSVITLTATISGETFENVLITEKQALGSITFGVAYAPFFIPENDKLAAHKVMSIGLEITIPENRNVSVSSNLASFIGSGKFKGLNVAMLEGSCIVTDFLGNGVFATLVGDIIIEALPQVSGEGISENGIVVNDLRKHQRWDIVAQSKHGNVHLSQTE